MSTILVDQDGTIAHWGGGWNRRLDEYGEDARGIPRHRDQRTFDLHAERTPEEIRIISDAMNTLDYSALEGISGARRALRQMVSQGHDVRIVTSPWPTNPTCASDKIAWVIRHYGRDWAKRVIITQDKTLVRGDFLIDDKPSISGAMEPTWEHVLYTQPYNTEVADKRRINTWSEWESLIND
jgi:5'-nucleotidase